MKKSTISASVVGATGYSGQELLRLLYTHENVEIKYISSHSYAGKKYSDIYRNSPLDMVCSEQDIERFAKDSDVVFIALPHGIASKQVTKSVLENTKIIDLGADFRLKDKNVYEQWYDVEHHGANLLDEAVYGLPELNREKIKNAKLLANPGCYATCSILSLTPLVKKGLAKKIIIDAKSGVSGAGRSLATDTLYCECNETIKAYKIGTHRHTPEIEQVLNFEKLTFTPHLTPMNRGILATCYVEPVSDISQEELNNLYANFYKDEYFVRIITDGTSAETRWVKGSNFCDISVFKDERTGGIIVTGAIDNLVKGAAGQAIQNLNIMFDLKEQTGLEQPPIFP